jgi:Uma2 family endonuclease
MATKTLLTIEQYNALEEPVGVRYELDRGQLIVTPSRAPVHNIICGELFNRLSAWAEGNHLGQVLYSVNVKLGEDTVRRPDVMFISRERMKNIDLEQVPMQVVPDLVIEVVSKFDRPDDLMLKVRQYVRAGVQAVWVLYPRRREACRYVPGTLQPTVVSVEREGKFEEPELLPGFSIFLSDILH